MAFVQTRLRNTAHQDHSSSNRPQLRLTPAAAALCMLFAALHAPAAESTLWPQQGGSEANPLVLDGTSYFVENNSQGGWYRLENDADFTGSFSVRDSKVTAVELQATFVLPPVPAIPASSPSSAALNLPFLPRAALKQPIHIRCLPPRAAASG